MLGSGGGSAFGMMAGWLMLPSLVACASYGVFVSHLVEAD
jgi:hypothetical protein